MIPAGRKYKIIGVSKKSAHYNGSYRKELIGKIVTTVEGHDRCRWESSDYYSGEFILDEPIKHSDDEVSKRFYFYRVRLKRVREDD